MRMDQDLTGYRWAAATLLLLLVSQLPQAVYGTAIVRITFINYRNLGGYDHRSYPCDPLINRACDNVFDICVDKRNGSDSITDCAFFKKRTGEYTNNDDITFDGNMMGVGNPITVRLDVWEGVKLKVSVTDDDSSHLMFSAHDLVDSLQTVYYTARPGVNNTYNNGTTQVIQGREPRTRPTSLTVKFEVTCDHLTYGPNCTKLCIPTYDEVNGHFRCDYNGDKLCLSGWVNASSNCTTPRDCRVHPCLGGGSCQNMGDGRFVCNCPPGVTGLRCQIPFHGCKSRPCLNGGICSIYNGTCSCPDAFQGHWCETRRTTIGCMTCDNGGTCEADRCICRPGTWGSTCQFTNTSTQCHNGGRNMHGRCLCPRGISGRYCQVSACNHITCENGGSCLEGWCHCPPGFGGGRCEVPQVSVHPGSYRGAVGSTPRVRASGYSFSPIYSQRSLRPYTGDPKTPAHRYTNAYPRTTSNPNGASATMYPALCNNYNNRCQNGGTCVSGTKCECPRGYLGDRCEVTLCAHLHCYHGANCLSGACICPQGYTGVYCQDHADTKCDLYYYGERCNIYCKPRNDRQGHYRCDSGGRKMCLPGWEDVNADCTVMEDDCLGHKCQNGGSCQDEDNSYSCTCRPGYIGTYCEIEMDECASNPCHNGGTCWNLVNRFECECPADYPRHLSETCSNHVCDHRNPCQHGGTCHGPGLCSCSALYTGVKCEIILCQILPCHNGGSCRQGHCHCPPPYTGSHCHKVTGTCSGRPCMYGGTCIQDGDSYSCACWEKFTGEHCQHRRKYNGTKLPNVRVDEISGVADSCIMHPTPIILLGLLLGLIVIVLILAVCLCREKRRRRKQAKVAQHATSNFPNPLYSVGGGGGEGRSSRRPHSTSGNSTSRRLGAHGGGHTALPGAKTISMVNEGVWDQNTDANFVFGSRQHSTKWAPGGAIDYCGPPPYTGYDVPEAAAGGEHGIVAQPNEEAVDEGVNPKDFELGGEGEEEVEYEILSDIAQVKSEETGN